MQETTIKQEQHSLKRLKEWYGTGMIVDWERILNLVDRMWKMPLKNAYQQEFRESMSPVETICSFLKRDGLIDDEEQLKNEGTYGEMLTLVKTAFMKRQSGVESDKDDAEAETYDETSGKEEAEAETPDERTRKLRLDRELENSVLPAVAELYIGFPPI